MSNAVEEAAKFILILLFAIFLMHVVLKKDGWAWLKSKFLVKRT